MESLGAIGLAANILQFVEFGTKVIRSTGEIYDSINGTTPQNNSLEIVATSISDWCSRLTSPPVSSAQTDDEKIIYLLANECQKISQEILELTWKIKPKNRKSRTDVFISALRNGWHESTKHDLLARLETCRSQLSTQLGSLNSSDRDEIKSRLKEVIRSVENNADEMISVRRKIDEINQGLNRLSLSSTVRHLLQSFLDIPLRAIAEHHILRSLSFGTMYQRFDQVQDAHVKSFHWIFEEPTKHTPLHHKSMPSFVNWLAKEGGIFHISGKLGSGKSTLLKYLCDHGKTTENLDQWSQKDGKKLIFAQFFFWRAGDHDQKSVSGLLRSLLHDILQQRPDLIPSVFAQHWKYLKSLDWRVQPTLNLRVKDIRAAFDTLIHSPRLYENNKLCFFIDGLDEYEETAHEDYKDMVDMLFLWVNMAPNDVKLCVSSRELEDFRKAFSEDKKLRLHELTRNDMESFVRGRLENFDILSASGASIEDNKRALVATITDRADGIFLWVSLVLNSLRERLQYDCQLSSLIQHTENMPKEMEPLFRHLLESIDQCDPRAAYRTFAMVLKLKEYRQNLPLIAYSFLAEYENDPHFAIADDVNNWGPGSDRLAMAKAKVNGQCKGLLEYRIAVDPHYEASLSAPPILIERVHVVHRTVFDFLHEETLQFKMANYCKGFDVMDAICQTYLASFKLNSILDTRFIVRFRKENFADTAPFRFFEALDSYNIPTQKELHSMLSIPENCTLIQLIGESSSLL
ncbi:hypothetical protein EMCG_04144 [[Emmonsia] crescens]|uniref:Uncharacterized protein n=1 Tax=[Emmonsia] crescens TaxID=73230 RepID=A0A0G2J7V0_9EURO|nr:hypothetical protein EMCG_04144 [Emmonsia crescens UAMH 3008]